MSEKKPLDEGSTRLPERPPAQGSDDPYSSGSAYPARPAPSSGGSPTSGYPAQAPAAGSSQDFYSGASSVFSPVPTGQAAAATALQILRGRQRVSVQDGMGEHRGPNPVVSVQRDQRVNSQLYEAEYWEKAIKDPAKRLWMAKRAIMLGYAKYNPESQWLVDESAFTGGGVYQMWQNFGNVVQMNPTLNALTPEEYIDSLYGQMGGDKAFTALSDSEKAAAEAAKPNPIQTTTQTSRYSMSSAQADAIADRVAEATLGRMASKSEMAKARKAMNRMMAANPTVSTTTSDATDPDNVRVSTSTKAGVGPEDASAAYEMKMKRSSEGMAFNVGKLMESAMAQMDRGL